MRDDQKPKKQLCDELATLRRRVTELEASELDRKRAKRALRDSKERYRILYDDNPSMYFTLDPDGTVLSVNQFGAEQLGYAVEELIGQSVLHVFHQDDKEAVLRQFRGCVQNPGVALHWEFRKVRKNGSLMWVREAARAIRPADGKTVVLIVCEDITERKQAEEALSRAHEELERRVEERTTQLSDAIEFLRDQIAQRRKAEGALHESLEYFRRLLESTRAVPWEADAKTWQFTYVGPQAVGLLGYAVDRWYEKDFWASHVHPDDREYAIEFCQRSSGNLRDYEFEYRMLRADGGIVWIHDIVSVVAVNGVPETLRGFMTDVTERKQAEDAIRLSEEEFRSMFELSAVGKAQADPATGRFTRVNKRLCEITGYTEDELLNLTFRDITHPDYHGPDEVAFQRVLRGEADTWSIEKRYRRKDGNVIWVHVNGALLRREGRPFRTVANILDVTHRKEIEEALRQLAGRLINAQEEERRRLARELHDDLTQRLAVLAIEAGKLEQQFLGAPEPVLGRLRQMKEQIVKLSADVHVISRQLHPSILDDLGLVSAMESECASFAQREGITVKYDPQGVPAPLPRDVALCIYRVTQEALRNIAKHARTKEAYVTLAGTDDGILLSIRDQGAGFDPSQLRGRAGLGLASMEERVRLVQGGLFVKSEPRQGTVIEVRVPLPRERYETAAPVVGR